MAIVSSLIGAVIVFYSFDYISHYETETSIILWCPVFGLDDGHNIFGKPHTALCFLGAYKHNIMAAHRLFQGTQHLIRADKSFLVTVFGAVLMLTGFAAVFMQTARSIMPR